MNVPALRDQGRRPERSSDIAAPDKIAPMWKLIPEVDAIIPLARGFASSGC